MNLAQLADLFREARNRYTADRPPNHISVQDLVDELHNGALRAVYAENDEGGKAREVVAAVARVLEVDIGKGDGHRWDLDHMARVVKGAHALKDECSRLREFHLTTDETGGVKIPAFADGGPKVTVTIAGQPWGNAVQHWATPEEQTSHVDDLRDTIVRQADEITALKGEIG